MCVRRGDVVFFDGVLVYTEASHRQARITGTRWPTTTSATALTSGRTQAARVLRQPAPDEPRVVDLDSFRANGYVVEVGQIPEALLDDAIDAIWKFGQLDPDNPQTWYRTPERANGLRELNGAGMVELYHHPALWATRQWPDVYATFSTLWQTEALWVSIDRCNFNPPNRGDATFEALYTGISTPPLSHCPLACSFLSLSAVQPARAAFSACRLLRPARRVTTSQPTDRDPSAQRSRL